MGLFTRFNKKEEKLSKDTFISGKNNKPDDEREWVEILFSFYLNGDISKEEMAKECLEIIEIFMNGQSMFNDEDEYISYANPKISKEATFLYRGKLTELHSKKLSKMFFPEMKKEGESWHIICKAKGKNGKDSKYSLNELYQDLYILWHIDEDLRARYGLEEGTPCSFNALFINGKPGIKSFEKLIRFQFKVEDQLEYESNPLIFKCLSMSIKERFDFIRKNKKKVLGDKKDISTIAETEKWISAVEKLLERK